MIKPSHKQLITGLLFGLIVTLLWFGREIFTVDKHSLEQIFKPLSGSFWALAVVISIFCLAAFIAVPQWLLISASILAFGPFIGGVYAWVATLVSASLDFIVARKFGASQLHYFTKALNSPRLSAIMKTIETNGFITSLVIRLIPSGPFIVVNMAAGLTEMRFLPFLCGTALGIIPKIIIVALIAMGVMTGIDKYWVGAFFIALAITIILLSKWIQKSLKPHF